MKQKKCAEAEWKCVLNVNAEKVPTEDVRCIGISR